VKISIIVTTYNRPLALDKVLQSISKLSYRNFEVIIADDGSTSDTREIIFSWSSKLSLIHAWQEDLGFRAAAARNLAVSKSSGDYLIFLDGDCLVFPNFLSRHLYLAEKNCLVAGNRLLLNERLTREVEEGIQYPLNWTFWQWCSSRMTGAINRLLPLVFIPGNAWRKFRVKNWKGVRTCNLGMFKSDFLRVNGFDESFVGWGHEDADLAIRLIDQGAMRKDGQFATAVLHLWHKENDRFKEAVNKDRALQGLNS